MGNLFGLFPIPVSIYTLDRALNEFELDMLVNQPQRSNLGNTSSKNTYILVSFVDQFTIIDHPFSWDTNVVRTLRHCSKFIPTFD